MLGTLEATPGRCTSGLIKGSNEQKNDTACNGGYAFIDGWFFEGWILLQACDTGAWISGGTPWPPPLARCISIQVPEPR